ncbi:alpha-L-rhamnosidase [Amycolatopsis balhimycina DSM 5908]|uniref:alpha-L-rhamnosidase n=1 Tax=Amycolatopsis balhimycina DSM 5908 TaxID=1081091 RepID=A0A428WMH0_AMYBA|nr:glycoside hydrolase family 78 protein [Amycolatopsis balhimycina]RSM44255.1 alpha-L-rhamnosidase [Amycolatopsis balhimycina DSM 5908]
MSPTWQARFISPAYGSRTEAGAPASYFRREFTVDGTPRRATLHVTAIGLVEPHLNGERVGDEVLAPGWTSYRHRLAVSSYDVTDRIVPGANAVGAIVGEGWALGRLGWEGKRHHYADRPALFLQLELEYQGRTEAIGTDTSFTTGTGAVLANSLYDGEEHDARLEPAGWAQPDFGDSWEPVELYDWDLSTLVTPAAPPIRRIEELKPVSITRSPSGKTIVDFGQNISGWVRLSVHGERGRTVTLRHAEVLTDGELDTETLRTAAATDRYTLRGGDRETWEPKFTFHGFRYAEVDGYPGTVTADDLTAVVVHSDMTRTGWFECSNPLLNQLHANIVWSMRDNFVGVPTDCPQRDERLGWTGDINAFAPTAAFLYDVRGVLGSWLADLGAEHCEKGYVPWVVPDVLPTPSSPTALWSDVAVSLPWTLYTEYGDPDLLRQNYDSMAAFIRDVESRLDDAGLWNSGYQFGDWLDPDAPMDNPAGGKTDRHLVASAFLCRTTTQLAKTAALLGKAEDAERFGTLAGRVREAFRHEYVTPSGRLANESATALALAICFDILDPAQETKAGDQLAAVVARAGYRISTGFAGTPFVTEALSRTGHLDEAYLLLLETGCPSFLYPVTMGATTIWERWDSIRPDGTINPSGMTSLNHYALGAIADWLHRVVGGLSPAEPGYRTMRIAPRPGGDLTHATVTHDTVHGRATVAWCIDDGRMQLDVTIPEGAEATVVLPQHPDELVVQVTAGEHSWQYEVDDSAASKQYTMDTPLRTLSEDPKVWRAVTDVFAKHFPGIPLDGSAPEAAGISLNIVLDHVPGASTELKNDLVAAVGGQEGNL